MAREILVQLPSDTHDFEKYSRGAAKHTRVTRTRASSLNRAVPYSNFQIKCTNVFLMIYLTSFINLVLRFQLTTLHRSGTLQNTEMRRSSQRVDSKSRPNIIKRAFVNVSVYFCYTTTYRDAHSHYMVLLWLPIPGTENILSMLLLKDVKSLQAVQRYACVPTLEVSNGIVIEGLRGRPIKGVFMVTVAIRHL